MSSHPQVGHLRSARLDLFPLVQTGLANSEHFSGQLAVQGAAAEDVQVAVGGRQRVLRQLRWPQCTFSRFLLNAQIGLKSKSLPFQLCY
jgi:hypothetical protein